MNEIEIILDKPYPKQELILKNKKRNNFILLPRRWGKTTFSGIIVLLGCLLNHNYRASWSAPTWKLMQETFESHRQILSAFTRRVSREDRRIELINGSVIEYWSSDDPSAGRGRKYHIWVTDETQRQKRLFQFIKASVRPCLADYRGELWILGTPNGVGSEFHDYYLECQSDPESWYIAHGKLEDNPYIHPDEILQMRRDLGPIISAQELDAQWVRIDGIAPLISKMNWENLVELPEEKSLALRVLALDASITSDTTALIGVHRNQINGHYYTDFEDIFCFEPENGEEIDFIKLESLILNLWRTGKYSVLAYDPYQSVSLIQRLKQKGVRTFEFTQNNLRAKSDSFLKRLLSEEEYHHPDHYLLTDHVLSATLKYTNNNYVRIVKSNKNKKIDLAVALSMAIYTHYLLNPGLQSHFSPQLSSISQSNNDNPFSITKTFNPY